jgi:hypothetical protein
MSTGPARAVAWELSVACARHAAGLDDGREVCRIAADVQNWEAMVTLVRKQALLPWLARALEEGGLRAADAAVRSARGQDAARALAQVRRLAELTRAFAEAGIPVLPYKGPALSLQLYGDVALRHSNDLDLVVPRPEYLRARKVLLACGFPPRGGHSLAQERALFAWLGHASFGAGSEDFVELHWRFAPAQFPFALSPERAIARSTRVMVAGQSIPLMAGDDLLVTLAMHGTRHLYERLEWLAGVALLFRTESDHQAALLRHAGALRGRRMLLASVVVAHRVLGLPLDAVWRAALAADAEARAIGDEIADLIIARGRDGVDLPDGATLQTLYARLIDSRLDRVRSFLRAALMPTEREWELVRLPDALTPLYHVIRPARVAMTYARRLFGGR